MLLRDVFANLYLWADSHAVAVLLAAFVWAAGGSLLAYIGKGGRTDSDGRAIASVIIGGAVLLMIVAMAALAIARIGFQKSPFDANVLLLAAPLVCVACSIAGIHRVFPLSELATVRTIRDVAVFVIVCVAGLWLLSTFRGWGVLFFGGLIDLALIGLMAVVLLRVLYRRAFRRSERLE